MNKTWFRRLLISYLPVFFIVTMILFMLLFQILNDQSRRDAMRANEYVAQQIMVYLDSTLKAVEHKVLRDVISNSTVDAFFNADASNVYANIMAVKAMDELKISHPYIHSTYFVRLADHFVLHDGSISDLETFADRDFVEDHLESQSAKKWTGSRQYTAFEQTATDQVVTIAKGYPFLTERTEGLYVVNLDIDALQREIKKMHNPGTSFVDITDQSGHELLGDASSETSGIYASFTSDYTGWTIASGVRQGEVVSIAFTVYNVWMVIAFGAVLFGVVWFLLITRRNYKPIQQMVSLLQTYSQKSDVVQKSGLNEFSFIHNTLESMLKQSEAYQQHYEENLIEQKKYVFHEVLERTRPILDGEWQEELCRYGYEVEGQTCAVHMVEVDGHVAFLRKYNDQDRALFKFVVTSAIQETAHEAGAKVWAEWSTDFRLSYIIWFPEGEDPSSLSEKLCKEYADWIAQYLSFTVTVSCGDAGTTLAELRTSYEQVLRNIEYKAVLGVHQLITSAQIPTVKPELRSLLGTIFQLIQSLRLSLEDWSRHLDVLIEQVRSAMLPRRDIDMIVTFLVQHLDRELVEVAKEYHDVWCEALDALTDYADQWETVEELKAHCTEVFGRMLSELETIRESKSHRTVIQNVRAYIEENYHNPDLSLDHLSEVFQMNGKYLSKMFKEQFGQNFVDVVIGLRINMAKKLLFSTDQSIQDISQTVGYTNYISFNRSFKNVVGISPRDFRKQVNDLTQSG